jgi:hypothetical protein
MSEIAIAVDQGRTVFAPGEELAGVVNWQLDLPAKSIAICLLWQTAARDHTDLHSIKVLKIDDPPRAGQQNFRFTLPAGPYSLKGKLITLTWAIEAAVRPGDLTQRVELVVSPGGEPVAPRLDG